MRDAADTLHNRQRLMIGSAAVTLVDDTGQTQMAQLDIGPIGPDGGSTSIRDGTPMVTVFGHASNPPVGSDVVVIFVGGDPSNAVAVSTNHKDSRLANLSPGDSALYDVRGAYVWLKETGLLVDAAGGNITIRNAANITISTDGDLTMNVTGNATINAAAVNLGGTGGAAVARVGDTVAGGVITSGSTSVKAV